MPAPKAIPMTTPTMAAGVSLFDGGTRGGGHVAHSQPTAAQAGGTGHAPGARLTR